MKVQYNEARYGRNDCGDIVCTNTWALIRDAADQWVADQQAAGRSDADIAAELATFDQWDRYDADGDGNFNEPDGYIDHFQIVHAGGDEADGDPYQGEDAIWSHRWYAFLDGSEGDGPRGRSARRHPDRRHGHLDRRLHHPAGERRPVGLHARVRPRPRPAGPLRHRGRRRQRRRLVDPHGAEPCVEAGRPGHRHALRRPVGAGTSCSSAGSTTRSSVAGDTKTLKLGPHEYNTALPQGAVVVLPPKDVTTDLVPPATGAKSWWSGSGDDLEQHADPLGRRCPPARRRP